MTSQSHYPYKIRFACCLFPGRYQGVRRGCVCVLAVRRRLWPVHWQSAVRSGAKLDYTVVDTGHVAFSDCIFGSDRRLVHLPLSPVPGEFEGIWTTHITSRCRFSVFFGIFLQVSLVFGYKTLNMVYPFLFFCSYSCNAFRSVLLISDTPKCTACSLALSHNLQVSTKHYGRRAGHIT